MDHEERRGINNENGEVIIRNKQQLNSWQERTELWVRAPLPWMLYLSCSSLLDSFLGVALSRGLSLDSSVLGFPCFIGDVKRRSL